MSRLPVLLTSVSAAVVIAATAAPATADPPSAGDSAGCNGLFVAANNQLFGSFSPSGNPHAAIGPGPFLSDGGAGSNIGEDREEACG